MGIDFVDWSWPMLGAAIGFAALYFGGGLAYGSRQNGGKITDLQTHPHAQSWKAFSSLVQDGIFFSANCLGIGVGRGGYRQLPAVNAAAARKRQSSVASVKSQKSTKSSKSSKSRGSTKSSRSSKSS